MSTAIEGLPRDVAARIISDRTGVHVTESLLRRLEDSGVVPRRRGCGKRAARYTPDAIALVALIIQLRGLTQRRRTTKRVAEVQRGTSA